MYLCFTQINGASVISKVDHVVIQLDAVICLGLNVDKVNDFLVSEVDDLALLGVLLLAGRGVALLEMRQGVGDGEGRLAVRVLVRGHVAVLCAQLQDTSVQVQVNKYHNFQIKVNKYVDINDTLSILDHNIDVTP